MSKKHIHDLSVRGIPEVISLKKLLKDPDFQTPGPFTVLVGEPSIRNNAKDQVAEISPKDRSQQALYFIKRFPKLYPPYLMKWMKIAYGEDKPDEFIHSLIDGAKHNREAQQVIGLIQLFTGALSLAKKMGKMPVLYIIEPETHLHPKRQAAIMDILFQIHKEEYGN